MSSLCSTTPISYKTRVFGDLLTFDADIGLKWPQMGVLERKIGKAGAILTPDETILTVGVIVSVPILLKIHQEILQ